MNVYSNFTPHAGQHSHSSTSGLDDESGEHRD